MTREEYYQKRESLNAEKPKLKFGDKPTESQKEKTSLINKELKKLVENYIELNKPCNVNDFAEIKLRSGKVVKGIVLEFGILHDGYVHPIAYKDGGKTKYITVPTQKLIIHVNKN